MELYINNVTQLPQMWKLKKLKEVREVKAICFIAKYTTKKAIGYNF